jgi:hypothetical protein
VEKPVSKFAFQIATCSATARRRGGVEAEKAERARCFADEVAERERQRERFNDMVSAARWGCVTS